MRSLHKDTKDNFKAKRYMDDVLLFMKKEGWDATRFYEDFKRSECYMPPLRLDTRTHACGLRLELERELFCRKFLVSRVLLSILPCLSLKQAL